MQKTAAEWFQELPEPYKTQATYKAKKEVNYYPSLLTAIGRDFIWCDSDRGTGGALDSFDYWDELYQCIYNGGDCRNLGPAKKWAAKEKTHDTAVFTIDLNKQQPSSFSYDTHPFFRLPPTRFPLDPNIPGLVGILPFDIGPLIDMYADALKPIPKYPAGHPSSTAMVGESGPELISALHPPDALRYYQSYLPGVVKLVIPANGCTVPISPDEMACLSDSFPRFVQQKPAREMKVVYLAHPIVQQKQISAAKFSATVDVNLALLSDYVRYINRHMPTIVPFAPYYADVIALDDRLSSDCERGLKNGRELLSRGGVDELWICGRIISLGMFAEIQLCQKLKIPVRWLPDAHQPITHLFDLDLVYGTPEVLYRGLFDERWETELDEPYYNSGANGPREQPNEPHTSVGQQSGHPNDGDDWLDGDGLPIGIPDVDDDDPFFFSDDDDDDYVFFPDDDLPF